MAVVDKTAVRSHSLNGQIASPINDKGVDERGVHVQNDGYRPVPKIGMRRASWLSPSSLGALGVSTESVANKGTSAYVVVLLCFQSNT